MLEHGDVDVETASRRGNFEADPAGTDHDELLVGGQGAQQRGGLIDCSHVVNALGVGSRDVEAPRPRTGGQGELVVADRGTVRK